MATCSIKLDLNEIDDKVVEYYKKLMDTSTAQDSIYLKAKETLKAILDDAGLDNREKSTILSQTISSMVSGLSAQAMQGAIDLAKDDRDSEYVLAKLCADTELVQTQKDKILADIAETEEDIKLKAAQGWMIQAQLHRDYGIIPSQLTSYTKEMLTDVDYNEDYGTKYEEIRLARSNIYNQYASGWRQNGYVSPSVDTDGFLTASTTSNNEGLSYWQTKVAERNEQAFDDNMRQHVANSSATMMSMLLSTDASGICYEPFVAQWGNAIGYLNGNEWIDTSCDVEPAWVTTLEQKY